MAATIIFFAGMRLSVGTSNAAAAAVGRCGSCQRAADTAGVGESANESYRKHAG